MATTETLYNHLAGLVGRGLLDLSDATADRFKVALVDSSYTFSGTHTAWADASASELSAAGYTAGGESLASVTYTHVSGTLWKWSSADVTWSALQTARAAVIYVNDTIDSIVNPLVAYILFDDTPGDVALDTIRPTVNGIFGLG